ncbi:branched-chain amino acid ABC transporter permease [Limnochorda pilosa]|uniref:Branched-chain amino acid ABC transporter permease n=1 Tax=Limnochorda pilosa TaxID=1555112 RepID=A0A0K2SLR3_LIMPI|nr:branched-chain amino acid ABC transporter permease [Limnochorda pilosa]BAS27759.1 branched-chain amino acid ABC transporter permease [Limnochorda pilosa]
MDVQTFVQQFFNGISLGSLYALIAIGYTMVYGILRLINFAHGDVFMVGAYVFFFIVGLFRLPWYLAIVLAMALTAGVGMLIDRTAYRPVREAPRISALITAVGVSFLLENGGIVVLGARPKAFPRPEVMSEVYQVSGAKILGVTFWVPVLALLLLGLLLFLIYRTKIGMAMRAVSTDMEVTRLMGVDVDRVISYTFAVGSALAAAGGIMWAFKYPQIQPLMGLYPGWKAFTAAVVGGIGSIAGATVGGFVIGMVEILFVAFFPMQSGFRDAVIFALLILFLLVRPTGLLGAPLKEKV